MYRSYLVRSISDEEKKSKLTSTLKHKVGDQQREEVPRRQVRRQRLQRVRI
jgi:hypothetical protein